MSYTTLLVATLLVLALYGVEGSPWEVVAWYAVAPPNMALLGRHDRGVAVINAPRAPKSSFGEREQVPAVIHGPRVHNGHGGRTYEGGGFAQGVSARIPRRIPRTGGDRSDFDTTGATPRPSHAKNQHAPTVFCTGL
jgi:hypothetical protein